MAAVSVDEALAICEVVRWDQNVFEASGYTIDSLVTAAERVDFAVLVATPDDVLTTRGGEHPSTGATCQGPGHAQRIKDHMTLQLEGEWWKHAAGFAERGTSAAAECQADRRCVAWAHGDLARGG